MSTAGIEQSDILGQATGTTFNTAAGQTTSGAGYTFRIDPAAGIQNVDTIALASGRVVARVTVAQTTATDSVYRGYAIGSNYLWIDKYRGSWRMIIVPGNTRFEMRGVSATLQTDSRARTMYAEIRMFDLSEDGSSELAPVPWIACRETEEEKCCVCGEYNCDEAYPH